MKFLLCPVLVQGRAEQERFYELFDHYWEELQQPWEMPAMEPTANRQFPGWLKMVLVALLMGGLAWAVIELLKPPPQSLKVFFDHPPTVAIGDTVYFKNLSENLDSTALQWEIVDTATSQTELLDTQSFNLDFVVKHAGKNNDRLVRLTSLNTQDKQTGKPIFHESSFHIKCSNPPTIDTIIAPREIILENEPTEFLSKLSKAEATKYKAEIAKINQREDSKPTGDSRPEVTYGGAIFEVKLLDDQDVELTWDFGDSTTATGSIVSHLYTKTGVYNVRLMATRTGQDGDCSVVKFTQVSVGRDKAYLASRLLEKDQVDAMVNFSIGTWVLMGILGLSIIWFWIKWAARKPPPPPKEGEFDLKAAAERYKSADKGPYFIPFRPQEGYIRMEPQFYRLADVLRIRQEGLRRNMDVPASVKKTIAEGGFPSLLSKADTVVTEYLFLVDEAAAGSHLSNLYTFLVDFLRKREVLGEVFYFKTEPIRFWNDHFPEGVNPDQLHRLFPYHRLIMLGNGHGLLDPHTAGNQPIPALRPDAKGFFNQWKQRLLLTPMPVISWTFREGVLHRLFPVFPSDTDGLGEAIKFLERGMDGEDLPTYTSWCERLLEGRKEPDLNYRRWRTAADHQDYLSAHPQLFQWVCALAVYPKPDWNITLTIGRALAPLGLELNYDNLLIISRIPWLQTGDLPLRLRKEFLNDLNPEFERLAREAVQTELNVVESLVKGSHVSQEHQVNLALQNFAIAPGSSAAQVSIRELLALNLLTPRALSELNQTVERHVQLSELEKKGMMAQNSMLSKMAKFEPEVPDIHQFLKENKPEPAQPEKPFFTKDFWRAVATSLLYLVIFLVAWNYSATNQLADWILPAGESKTNCEEKYLYARLFKKECVADSAVLFNNAGVDAYLAATDTVGAYGSGRSDFEKASLLMEAEKDFGRAISLRPDYPKALANLGSYYFNAANVLYTASLEGLDLTKAGPVSPTVLWDEVLPYFRKAIPFENVKYDALHGIGLVHFYSERQDSALAFYNILREETDSLFFDTLQMFPNLQTLLARSVKDITDEVTVSVTEDRTGKPLSSVSVISKDFTGRTDRAGKIVLKIPKGEKRTFDFVLRGYEPAVMELNPSAGNRFFKVKLSKVSAQASEAQASVVERDSDKDGVPDKLDKCPNEKGPASNYGCPVRDEIPTKSDSSKVVFPQDPVMKFKEPEMVFVKGGTFQMGCDEKRDGECAKDEKPVHDVTLSDFSIGKYEVTNEEYAVFLNEYGSTTGKEGQFKGQELIGEYKWGIAFPTPDNSQKGISDITKTTYQAQKGYEKYPVVNVTWYGAVAYTEWLSQKTGKNFRLPTEAEWEYAARGGSQSKDTKYSGSNNLDEVAWYSENSGNRTHSVGQKRGNELGAFDMSGNVWEWCGDWYDENYYQNFVKGSTNNPKGPASGVRRVLRGGSWDNGATWLRPADRSWGNPGGRYDNDGFRVAQG
ncbi:MAG: SUMF1/EgtB/PvdO family nonheme iron enzyme [Saprospiraceae bacterium]|nr:SUMF1/EgtB/PvdO family nonheme iron enzyme [Saprospiraceae bacterium]MCF8249914.1 SUMF1/EgtB/PvdO family nonheme iron enzyme [Saprospiraceae bacterium]MCF8279327.1 SUMF1/EgtB/PvdO family nonheme iron enzyme [Bacteroidales bacterium]MCF8310018.1 SUMF1/EgtB/PvdO family nonheme iron enzyme [Saprospiraceae bacterium]MCF8438918.1 SUMF1/EgtB/PvdO family nonheme iron enzyme [Saprospiraceae bacterium]